MSGGSISRWLRGRWFDRVLAFTLLSACEIELVLTKRVGGPREFDALLLAALSVPTAWRRRAPLGVACIVVTVAVACSINPITVLDLQTPVIVFLIAPYSVAAYEPRTRALTGLAVCVAGLELTVVIGSGGASSGVFLFAASIAAWGTGRALRSRRLHARQLSTLAQRIAHERRDHQRLAVADERARIARELQAIVARSVTAMVVQSQTAQRLLDTDAPEADEAMAEIERTGHEALSEMRRILGVLRTDHEAELAPQPGIGSLPTLVEHARTQGHDITLHLHGEPRPLPAGVDLGVYRILEEALTNTTAAQFDRPIAAVLRFGDTDITLELTMPWPAPLNWPTATMRERIALCNGQFHVESDRSVSERLHIRMPAVPEEVFA